VYALLFTLLKGGKNVNKKEYSEYEESVKNFFEREGITNLSRITPEEDTENGDYSVCPHCGAGIDYDDHFSWSPCECCGSTLGGNRVHCAGYHPENRQIVCYDVCVDCEYYAEYGQLDDMTMLEIGQE